MTHAEAVGCMAANVALPGAGSLAAGKPVGYAQLVIATVGLIMSSISCTTALKWFFAVGFGLSADDPGTFLIELWRHLTPPLVGIGVFLVAFGWGIITGRQILAAHPKETAPPPIVE